MIQQQRFGGNMLQVTLTIGKKYGLGSNGIMRAVFPTILRDSLYVAGMLGVTPMVQDFLVTHNNLSENQAGFYASLIGSHSTHLLTHSPNHLLTHRWCSCCYPIASLGYSQDVYARRP